VEGEINDIQAVEKMERQEAVGYRELLLPWVRPMLVVGVGLAIVQQLSGINTVIYFAPSILEATGFEALAAILGTVGVGVMNTLMTIVAIVLLDRVGQRPLLLMGLFGMIVSLGALCLIYLLPSLSGVVGYAALVCVGGRPTNGKGVRRSQREPETRR
jgi:predicted MFS family arabinose efflux permease